MAFPQGLKKVFGVETPAAPPREVKPFIPAEWAATNRTDGVRTLYDEEAANYFADGLTEAQREGLRIQVAMLDLKERQR